MNERKRTRVGHVSQVLKIGNVEVIGSHWEFDEELHVIVSLALTSVRDSLLDCIVRRRVPDENGESAILYTYYRHPNIADTSVADLSPTGDSDDVTGESYTVTANGRLIIDAEIGAPNNLDALLDVVRPILQGRGLEILGLSDRSAGYSSMLKIEVSNASVERYTIRDMVEILRSIRLFLNFGELDRSTAEGVYLAAASGNAERLIGTPEGEHFDVKEKGHPLSSDYQKFKFSVDLASFANTDMGGVIIIGAKYKKDANDQDVVDQVPGCRPDSLNFTTMRNVANSWIVPRIKGLDFLLAPTLGGKQVCIIVIPSQPVNTQPFLVRGNPFKQEKNISGSGVTVPYRRGDLNLSQSPEAIHSLLVAGLAALNGPHESRRRVANPAKIRTDEIVPKRPSTR